MKGKVKAMIWTNRDAKICTAIILGVIVIAALFALVVGGCTTVPEPIEPTPTPTMETSPVSPVVTPAIPDLVPVPVVTIEAHPSTIRIQATDIVTFSMELLWDEYFEIDPGETSPEDLAAAISYTLVAMTRIKHDGLVISEDEFDTGIGPYMGDAPGTGRFAMLHFHIDRMQYEWPNIYKLWATGCWHPPADSDLPIVCFKPGPDEIVDGAGYSYLGEFRGSLGRYNIYLPLLIKSGAE